jgi:hypothetical protein
MKLTYHKLVQTSYTTALYVPYDAGTSGGRKDRCHNVIGPLGDFPLGIGTELFGTVSNHNVPSGPIRSQITRSEVHRMQKPSKSVTPHFRPR